MKIRGSVRRRGETFHHPTITEPPLMSVPERTLQSTIQFPQGYPNPSFLGIPHEEAKLQKRSRFAQGPQTGWWPGHQATHLPFPTENSFPYLMSLSPIPQAHLGTCPLGCWKGLLSLDLQTK